MSFFTALNVEFSEGVQALQAAVLFTSGPLDVRSERTPSAQAEGSGARTFPT